MAATAAREAAGSASTAISCSATGSRPVGDAPGVDAAEVKRLDASDCGGTDTDGSDAATMARGRLIADSCSSECTRQVASARSDERIV